MLACYFVSFPFLLGFPPIIVCFFSFCFFWLCFFFLFFFCLLFVSFFLFFFVFVLLLFALSCLPLWFGWIACAYLPSVLFCFVTGKSNKGEGDNGKFKHKTNEDEREQARATKKSGMMKLDLPVNPTKSRVTTRRQNTRTRGT